MPFPLLEYTKTHRKMTIHDNNDTICAISTPHGVGGIAVIRISGRDAIAIVDRLWKGRRLSESASHTAHLGTIVDDNGEILDQAVATVFRGPNSFTGEDVVELSVHGSKWIQRETINLLVRTGCRIADAGEFTRRAFASGRLDLAEAEAVADVIASSSRAAHRVAMRQMRGDFSGRLNSLREQLLELASLLELELDFSEEDVEFASRRKLLDLADEIHSVVTRLAATFATGSALKEGIPVSIVGATNVGKSTLLNRLLHDDRAIVSDIHGTTRDVIEDTMEIGGVLFRLIDTAGLRSTSDTIEALGIERTINKLKNASIILWMVDATAGQENAAKSWAEIESHLSPEQHLIAVVNKIDAGNIDITSLLPEGTTVIRLSARNGEGISALEQALVNASGTGDLSHNDIMVTNARHYEALTHAANAIARAIDGLKAGLSGDFIAQDIRETLYYLGEITGTITTPDILATIFSRFCVGK